MLYSSPLSDLKRIERIAGIGSWTMDLASGFATWSEEARRIYGFDENDNIHTFNEWETFLHPNDVQEVRNQLAQADIHKKNCSFQHRIVNRKFELRHIQTSFEYVLDDSGTATRILGVAQDVTDIVNIKNKFSRSEENLKLLFDLIPLSIYARKKNGDYIFGNHIFLGHYGITAEELIGKNLRDFATPEEQEELKLQDAQVFESGKNLFVSEFKQKNRTGKLTYWRILKIPFVPIGETDMAMLGIAEDITLEKERVNRIIAYSNAIKDRNKQLEDFSYKVSHDLRGPLSTIMGIAQVIDFINLSHEEQNYFMNGIREAVKKMDFVVHELNELVSERPQPEDIG